MIQRADYLFRIDDLYVCVGLDIAGGDHPGLGSLDEKIHRLTFLGNDEDLLQVENDIGYVLHYAIDRLELMVDAVDLDGGDRRALDRAKQHPAQRVADGVAVAGLKGLGDKLRIGGRGALLNLRELAGQFELSEAFWHGGES